MAVAMSMTVSVCVQLLVGFINGDRGIGVQPAFHQDPNDSPLVSEDARAAVLEGHLQVSVKMFERLEHVGIRIDYKRFGHSYLICLKSRL